MGVTTSTGPRLVSDINVVAWGVYHSNGRLLYVSMDHPGKVRPWEKVEMVVVTRAKDFKE